MLGEALEFVEREAKAALGGIRAALEAGEIVPAGTVPGLGFPEAAEVVLEAIPPVNGFGFAQAAELPLVVDENIDQDALLGERGLPALAVLRGEVSERDGIFAGNDLGYGVNAGFKTTS